MAEVFEPYPSKTISIIRGDITRVHTDAIVNAANSQLTRGGGVCGAIHAAGGPRIAEECREWIAAHGPVATGEAAITGGGELPASFVIHAVGPVWHGGHSQEEHLLASAYRESMRLAEEAVVLSIAFPSISTGIFGYPVDRAAPVALETVAAQLRDAASVTHVRFVAFDEPTYRAYTSALHKIQGL